MEPFGSICQLSVQPIGSIGERLREERERLGYNQEDFARLTPAKTRQTQSRYEKGRRSPDAHYLAAAAEAGADVNYLVTGARTGPIKVELLRGAIAGLEEHLRAHRLELSPDAKADVIVLLYQILEREGQPADEKQRDVARVLRLVQGGKRPQGETPAAPRAAAGGG